MQEVQTTAFLEQEDEKVQTQTSLLDLPLARLQIVQARGTIGHEWLDRPMIGPLLSRNADGLWLLSLRRQGEYGKFDTPYVHSQVLLADAQLGMIVILVSFHGNVAYGSKRNKRVQKGQFYRFFRQVGEEWSQVTWQQLGDELRQVILELHRPEWARSPGKLSSEKKPPAKRVEMISYKVVRLIEGRYYSLYDPEVEYVLGQRMKQSAKPGHGGGYFSYPTEKQARTYLASCISFLLFHREIETPQVALLECEVGGRIIRYADHKMASTYLLPVRVLEVCAVRN